MTYEMGGPEDRLTQEQRNRLIDMVLAITKELREKTRPMTNDEKIFFLKCLRIGVEGAENKFRDYDTKGDQNAL